MHYANCKKIFNLTSLFSTPSILSTSKQKKMMQDVRKTQGFFRKKNTSRIYKNDKLRGHASTNEDGKKLFEGKSASINI